MITSSLYDTNKAIRNSTSLLTAKLNPPSLPAGTLLRPRLIEKLNNFTDKKLTLICAPAGFGKTVLISDWLKTTRTPHSWWLIDKHDNQREQFIFYLIAALQKFDTNIGSIFDEHSIKNTDIFSIMTTLINDISQMKSQCILILDNYHRIHLPEIHQFMDSFINFLPSQVHLVLLSRNDQHLSLGRLRIQDQIIEIRASELKFNLEEIKQFGTHVFSLDLSPTEQLELESLTNGWVAAIQMAVLFIKNQDSHNNRLSDFNGHHRFVYDFIYEEIWIDLKPDLQQFLAACSILEYLSPELCTAVTGMQDSASILNDLYRCSLFITPIHSGTHSQWYQIHHLFLGFLKQNLDPCQKLEYHWRAAEWYENNGYDAEALQHALAAGNIDHLIQLIDHHSIVLLEFGKVNSQIELFNTLPKNEIESQPWLCISYAWALILSGDLGKVDNLLSYAENIQRVTPHCVSGEEIQSQILFVRAFQAFFLGNYEKTMHLCKQANLLPRSTAIKILIARLEGLVYLNTGNLKLAETSLKTGFQNASAINDFQNMGVFSLCLANVMFERGDFQQAEIVLNRLVQLPHAKETDPHNQFFLSGQAYTKLGLIYFEWNQTENIRRLVLQGLRFCEQNGNAYDRISTYLEAVILFDKLGDSALVENLLDKAGQLGKKISSHYLHLVNLAVIQHFLFIGDFPSALKKWEEITQMQSIFEPSQIDKIEDVFVFSKIQMAQGKFTEAEQQLLTILPICQQSNLKYRLYQTYLMLTELALLQREQHKATTYLKDTLTIAAQQGYIGSFLSNKSVMDELVRISNSLPASLKPHVQKIIKDEKNTGVPPNTIIKEFVEIKDELIEPLSDRELEVLCLIHNGHSNQEISEQLTITLGTTKWHTVNIFRKLKVHSRTQAIKRGIELNILDDTK